MQIFRCVDAEQRNLANQSVSVSSACARFINFSCVKFFKDGVGKLGFGTREKVLFRTSEL